MLCITPFVLSEHKTLPFFISLQPFNACKQEKEIVERQNAWLNEELTTKTNSFLELRRKHTESESDTSSKLADVSIILYFKTTMYYVLCTFNLFLIFCLIVI